jgi:hypothetical protein
LRHPFSLLKVLTVGIAIILTGVMIPDQAVGMKGLFNTKAAAEKAAKRFGCSGAHKMGKKWMPCFIHEVHDQELNHQHHN